MATVLDRLEQLVREVIAALRENSVLLGRVYSVLERVEAILREVSTDVDSANALQAEANDIAKAEADAAIITRSAFRDTLKVIVGWMNTPYAGVIAVSAANLVLAWIAHWVGVPLPFLPSPTEVPHVPVVVPVSSGG